MKQDLIDKAEAALAGYRGALALGIVLMHKMMLYPTHNINPAQPYQK